MFSDKQEFTLIQQLFYRNSTGIQIEFLKIGRNIRLCYTSTVDTSFLPEFRITGIQFTGIHRNSPEFLFVQ